MNEIERVLSGTQWTEEPEISLKSQNQLEWIGQTKPESFENIDWKLKMSHPDSPGSPTHPEKVIRAFSCVVCTRILILSACRSWRLLFLFLLLTMIFVQGENHYQSSLEREVPAIEQTAGCLPPRVTPIIHQFKSNRRQLDFWGYYPGRCQQTKNCQT